jgi:hypothetical protein
MASTFPTASNKPRPRVEIDFDAYKWPPLLDKPPPLPDWLQSALLIGDLRVSDDLGHIRTPEGELTIHPGDWIIKTRDGHFAVWSDILYHSFMSSVEHRDGASLHPDKLGTEGAEFGPLPSDPAADPHNAQLEGADQPDEPDTSDPKAA